MALPDIFEGPDTPEKEQLRFESMFDDEQLNDPLNDEDADQVGENLANVQHDVRFLYTRAVRQYRGQSWVSTELWAAYCKLEEAWNILQRIYDHDGFTHPEKRRGG